MQRPVCIQPPLAWPRPVSSVPCETATMTSSSCSTMLPWWLRHTRDLQQQCTACAEQVEVSRTCQEFAEDGKRFRHCTEVQQVFRLCAGRNRELVSRWRVETSEPLPDEPLGPQTPQQPSAGELPQAAGEVIEDIVALAQELRENLARTGSLMPEEGLSKSGQKVEAQHKTSVGLLARLFGRRPPPEHRGTKGSSDSQFESQFQHVSTPTVVVLRDYEFPKQDV